MKVRGIEYRAAASMEVAPHGRLEGYAAVFDEETRIGDFLEVIRRGAFSKSLKDGRDILCLVDHNPSRCIGRTKSGTLQLFEDAKGLFFDLSVPDPQEGHDLLVMARRGDLGGMSFGFNVGHDAEVWTGKRRELRSVILHEISVVHAWPAYQGTYVEARQRLLRLERAKQYMVTV